MVGRIFLVACVARKREAAPSAADLYDSTWFRLARTRVEKTGEPWFILSAKHGLLAPDTVILRYEESLLAMGPTKRRAWADRVIGQMESDLPTGDEVVILAGKRYRENLLAWLRNRFERVKIPMENMKIGQQLSWLKHDAIF